MIPSSREKGRGAYRDLMLNYINGKKDIEQRISGRKNEVLSTLTTFSNLTFGFFNYLRVRKRRVSTKTQTFILSSSVSIGDNNNIDIAYWSPQESNFSTTISAGNGNNIDVVIYEADNVSVGSENHIRGKLNIANGGTIIGDNNILIDFTPELTVGSKVYGLPELSELMFETEVVAIASTGATEIEVDDTSKIMLGVKFFFGTLGAAFADRIVTSIDGNLIGFETPLSSKEVTIVGSRVFNHYPEMVPLFESSLAEEVEAGSKRIVINDLGSLHLREITINDSFYTKSFFQRTSDNMVIIRDATDSGYPIGTPVTSEGAYPYSAWDTSTTLDFGATYIVDNPKNSAYIGRSINIDAVDYYIIGFTDSTVTFNTSLPLESYESLVFSAVDDAPGGGPSSTTLSSNSPGDSSTINVVDSSLFFVGQVIRVDEIVKLFVVNSISGNTITLDEQLFGDSINNSFYVGRVELPIDIATTKADIEAGALDLNTYIFGG